ncbi:hypothetical protein [Cohnella sp. AR92]|uniref:hypothetical protein n=1 Tax=Cohnella sp. AR92 TaxID=648716 RepID=UPI000F8C44FE|nr:hypothetical protein [Cohnella sp. AR92]RUS48338.1 hypothetical protein ELR57_02640 [Cohnella sp. AR92]
MSDLGKLARRLVGVAACAIGIVALNGCAAGNLSPTAAFALSASALSGTDRFGFDGRLSAYDPSGRLESQTGFRGEVSGHKPSALVWEGTAATASSSSYWNHPLTLVSAIEAGSSDLKYVSRSSDEVELEMKLDPDVARDRIKKELRSQMSTVALETGRLISERREDAGEQAKSKLEQANRVLDEALGTLSVSTVCRWKADPRTWFPKSLSEESLLTYTLSGNSYTEKRISETNFQPGRDSDTMKNGSTTK